MTTDITNPNALTNDMLADASMHRLGIMISKTGVDVVITSRVNQGDLIFRHITFPEGSDPMSAFEEVVYDNPLLTADFHQTYVIIDNRQFFLMDEKMAGDEEITRRMDLLWPASRTGVELETLKDPVTEGKTVLVSGVPASWIRFVRRTFNNPAIMHRMGVLTRYYAIKNKLGNMGKIHVRLGEDTTDILAFGHQGLLLSNTFDTQTTDDAAYYTMAVARHFEFDNETDRILVSGEANVRDCYMARMRQFIHMVLPEIYPADLASQGSSARKVPFELLVYPLVNK